jgi:hypothetical protein
MPGQTPHDLAVYVYGRLANASHRPAIGILDELFHTLYLTSMRREEGTPITCSISYVNPRNPDPAPPPYIRDPRWTIALLAKPIDYTAAHLTKLALAADPASSCLVVYPNRKNELQIWGLIDQQGGFQAMLSHETEGGWSPPGAFHVQVLGPGHLVVMDEITLLAELNGDHLVEDSVDVFMNPAIRRKFRRGFERRIRDVVAKVQEAGYGPQSDILSDAYNQWITTIRRILLRARTFGHGGAFLFTDVPSASRLNIKYDLVYDRLPKLLYNVALHFAIEAESSNRIMEQLDSDADIINARLYLDNQIAKDGHEDACDALSGAVAYVASLSRVDGLVLLDYDLVVRGFGCEITAKGDSKCQVYRAIHSRPTRGKLRRLEIQRFGTRHRSMVRYCTEDKSSVGFIVSHDGPVRAISCSSSRLYFWDSVEMSRRENAS